VPSEVIYDRNHSCGYCPFALAVGLFVFRAISAYGLTSHTEGKRIITCQETQNPAAVDVAAAEVVIGAFLADPTLRLQECSRWPEYQDCGQECLQQIEVDPEKCLIWNIVSQLVRQEVRLLSQDFWRTPPPRSRAAAVQSRPFISSSASSRRRFSSPGNGSSGI
jgi:hypothetical protein